MVRQPVNVAELVRETVAGLHSEAGAVDVTAPDELIAEVDPERIRQVLENLLTNARNHAPGSPVMVTIRPEARPAGPWVVLRVQDRGPGIAPEILPQLTGRFVRGQRSRGLGLGLYLTRSIAEAHGGRLTIDSTLGVGTTFTLALPTTEPTASRELA